MPKTNSPVVSFNHGLASRLTMARVDLARMRFAAEEQTNWMPRTVGPMTLRPGTQIIGGIQNNAYMQPIPFVFAHDDTAIIEMTGGTMRVRVNDLIVSRPAVSTTIPNGDFATTSDWDLATLTTAGATAQISGGVLTMDALAIGSVAVAFQAVATSDVNIQHALRIIVVPNLGPIWLKVGLNQGNDDLVSATRLESGYHSITFTPTSGIFYVQLECRTRYPVVVASVEIESAGILELPTPYTDVDKLRWAQSGDVVYLACDGHWPRKIERRANDSWSFVYYSPQDGPFKSLPSDNVLLTPDTVINASPANPRIEADRAFFTSSMLGSLLRITHNSQVTSTTLAAADTYTSPIRVTGVHDPDTPGSGGRVFTVTIIGPYSGTLLLQRSFDGEDIGYETVHIYAADEEGTFTVTDEFDNSIAWYRVGFNSTSYSSGTVEIVLSYPAGGGSTVIEIVSLNSSVSANVRAFTPLINTTAGTREWQEGGWSEKYGYPSAVAIHEGRLWWFGQDRIWGSVSDAYESFDADLEGDAGPIQRSIGYGPVETISWALPLQRLIVGTGYSEVSIRSSSFEEPLTPTNFGLKDASTQGSSRDVAAVKVDSRGLFVTRSKRRLYQLMFSVENADYTANDMTAMLPDLGSDLKKIAVQRHPDTRIHVVCDDGTALVLLFEPKEEVVCWYKVETDGVIENVVVLPEDIEDRVYYCIRRTINGSVVRYLEKFARLDQCTGAGEARLADSHLVYSGLSSATITGLDHLEGETVVAWAWDNGATTGTDFSTLGSGPRTFVVNGGQILLPSVKANVVVGLPYRARFRSAKLAYAAAAGTALVQKKRIDHLGLILMNTHGQGIKFGQNFTRMDGLPQMYQGQAITADTYYPDYDEPSTGLPGKWDTDSRLCIEANAPRPVTVLGAVISMATHDKI